MEIYNLILFKESTFKNKETKENIEYSTLFLLETKENGEKDILRLKTLHSQINKEELRDMKMGTPVSLDISIQSDGTAKVSHVKKA